MGQELLSTLSHIDFLSYRSRIRSSVALLISWSAGGLGSPLRRSSAVMTLLTAVRALAGLLDLISQVFRPTVRPYFLLLARMLMPDLHQALAACQAANRARERAEDSMSSAHLGPSATTAEVALWEHCRIRVGSRQQESTVANATMFARSYGGFALSTIFSDL